MSQNVIYKILYKIYNGQNCYHDLVIRCFKYNFRIPQLKRVQHTKFEHFTVNITEVSESEILLRPRARIVQSLTADNSLITEAIHLKFCL